MLNEQERKLLNLVQREIPLCQRPFAEIARQLGMGEELVLQRLADLKARGYIRRIGPFFDSSRLGYSGTLVALEVEPDRLPAVAEAINAYPGVTHNYEREGVWNLWLTLLTPNDDVQDRILREIGSLPGVNRMINLPAIKKYKVNVQFQLE